MVYWDDEIMEACDSGDMSDQDCLASNDGREFIGDDSHALWIGLRTACGFIDPHQHDQVRCLEEWVEGPACEAHDPEAHAGSLVWRFTNSFHVDDEIRQEAEDEAYEVLVVYGPDVATRGPAAFATRHISIATSSSIPGGPKSGTRRVFPFLEATK
jgi:hypothetical protein